MSLNYTKTFNVLGVVLALSVVGCSKRPQAPVPVTPAEDDRDRVSVDLNIGKYLKPDLSLGEQEKVIVQELSEGKKISHRGLTELFVARHQKTRSEITGADTQSTSNLETIVSQLKAKGSESPDQFKKSLEEVLASASGKSLENFSYNRDAVNIFDYLNAGLFQCYSATSLYMVSRRSVISGEDFLKDSPFIIYESGHIKSGFRNKDGQVVALEHTDLGPARETFTSEAEFEEFRQSCDIRVVDSNKWILNEIFKDSLDLSDAEKRLAYLTEMFGEKYAHCFEGQSPMSTGDGSGSTGLNGSDLGFGSSNARTGNIKPDFSEEKLFKPNPVRFSGGVLGSENNLVPGVVVGSEVFVGGGEKPKEPVVIDSKPSAESEKPLVKKLEFYDPLTKLTWLDIHSPEAVKSFYEKMNSKPTVEYDGKKYPDYFKAAEALCVSLGLEAPTKGDFLIALGNKDKDVNLELKKMPGMDEGLFWTSSPVEKGGNLIAAEEIYPILGTIFVVELGKEGYADRFSDGFSVRCVSRPKLSSLELKAEIQKLKGIASVKSGDVILFKPLDYEEISDKEFLARVRLLNQFLKVADERGLQEKEIVGANVYASVFYDLSYIDWFAKKILGSEGNGSYKSPAVVFFERAPVEVSQYLFDNGRGMHTGGTQYLGAIVFLKNEICAKSDLDPKFAKLCIELAQHLKSLSSGEWGPRGISAIHSWETENKLREGRPQPVPKWK